MSDFMKLDTARLEQAGRDRAGVPPEQRAPENADVDAFQRAMGEGKGTPQDTAKTACKDQPGTNTGGTGSADTASDASSLLGQRGNTALSDAVSGRGERGERGSRGEGSPAEPRRGEPGVDDMEPPLSQLFSQMSHPLDRLSAPAQVQAPESLAPAQHVDELVESLVDRILVSEPGNGKEEIRIRLAEGALPDTEIRLTRGADGLLDVRLETKNQASFQTLVGAQDGLKAQLERLERDGVRVAVTSGGADTQAENGDAQRRSRGQYFDENGKDA